MTDALERAVDAASTWETFVDLDGNKSIRMRSGNRGPRGVARDVLEAALEDLDAVIRKVDGNHDLGAGALADAIREQILGESN